MLFKVKNLTLNHYFGVDSLCFWEKRYCELFIMFKKKGWKQFQAMWDCICLEFYKNLPYKGFWNSNCIHRLVATYAWVKTAYASLSPRMHPQGFCKDFFFSQKHLSTKVYPYLGPRSVLDLLVLSSLGNESSSCKGNRMRCLQMLRIILDGSPVFMVLLKQQQQQQKNTHTYLRVFLEACIINIIYLSYVWGILMRFLSLMINQFEDQSQLDKCKSLEISQMNVVSYALVQATNLLRVNLLYEGLQFGKDLIGQWLVMSGSP